MNNKQLRDLMFSGKLVMITPTNKTWKKIFNYCVVVRCQPSSKITVVNFQKEETCVKWLRKQKDLEYHIIRYYFRNNDTWWWRHWSHPSHYQPEKYHINVYFKNWNYTLKFLNKFSRYILEVKKPLSNSHENLLGKFTKVVVYKKQKIVYPYLLEFYFPVASERKRYDEWLDSYFKKRELGTDYFHNKPSCFGERQVKLKNQTDVVTMLLVWRKYLCQSIYYKTAEELIDK